MIEFRQLPDDHPDFTHSPLLRAARLTLQIASESGSIGLTKTNAFQRAFVAWAAQHFEWPGSSYDDLMRYSKVLNEYDFPPLELLHFLLINRKLGRHHKGSFRITAKGKTLLQTPNALFHELIPYYILNVDHASYGRFGGQPFGNWDVWLNVINVEVDRGTSEQDLFSAFYGDVADMEGATWREMAAFSHCVLTPLEWAGLITAQVDTGCGRSERQWFKTPLWKSMLKLDTDDMLTNIHRH